MDDEDESQKDSYDTDEENIDDNGWITKKSKFNVPSYGNVALYIGRILHTTTSSTKLKVNSVVFKKVDKDKAMYFKCFNVDAHRTAPPPNSDSWTYLLCTVIMGNRKSNSYQLSESKQLDGYSLVGRNIIKDFHGTKFKGKIVSYDKSYGMYGIVYEDNDEEELNMK